MSEQHDPGRLEELLAEAKRRGGTVRRNRRAAFGGGLGALLIVVLAVVFFTTRPTGTVLHVGGSPTPPAGATSSASPSPVAPPGRSPSAASGGGSLPGSLAAFVSSTAGAGYASPIVTVDGVPTAVVEVTKSTTLESIDVVSLTDAAATLEASLSLTPTGGAITDFPFLNAADAQATGAVRIATGDVTGDGQPDFLVLFEAADNSPGVVLSNDGGTWRLVPFSATDPTMIYLGQNPKISGGHLTATRCGGPACAPSITLTWTYVRPGGYFTSS